MGSTALDQRQSDPATAPLRTSAALLMGLALFLTLVLGVLSLWTPFLADQSIFAYGGRAITRGETLYIDYWDIKPPGVFFFYAVAGRLLTLSEPVVHTVELLWQLAAGAALAWIALICVQHPVAAALAPLASIGTYYAFSTSDHLTQVESLMALPLALALVVSFKLSRNPVSAGWSFLLGASIGVTALLKQIYVLIPAFFVLLLLVRLWQDHQLRWRSTLRAAIFVFLGMSSVLAPVILHFAVRDALPEFLWVTLRYPIAALQEVPSAPASRLRESILWTLQVYLPFLPLVLFGSAGMGRTRQPGLSLGVLLYGILAAILIWLQRTSWWEYHQVVLFAPLGLLATLGLDRVLTMLSFGARRRWLAALAAVVLLAPAAGSLVHQATAKALKLKAASRSTLQAPLAVRMDRDSRQAWNRTEFLRDPASPSGPIYVFGDQRYLWMSGRRQAIAVRGHAWEHLPESMWQTLPDELMAARPTYVFVSRYYRKVLRRRAPQLLDFVRANYRRTLETRSGYWWVHTDFAKSGS